MSELLLSISKWLYTFNFSGGHERYFGEPIFIAQGYHERGVHCGKVKRGQTGVCSTPSFPHCFSILPAYIPYDWKEVAVKTYNILCRKRPCFSFYNTIGACGTDRDSREVRSGATFSKNITFPRPTSDPPRLVIGLNQIDIRAGTKYRVSTSTDNITTTGFTAHINTWSNTTLYNATISWLKLSAADPDFQCGTTTVENANQHRVLFDWKFDVTPIVCIALTGFKFSKDAKISIYADHVEWTGYQDDVDKTSWEPASNLTNCTKLVKEFHNTNPSKPIPFFFILSISLSFFFLSPLIFL